MIVAGTLLAGIHSYLNSQQDSIEAVGRSQGEVIKIFWDTALRPVTEIEGNRKTEEETGGHLGG